MSEHAPQQGYVRTRDAARYLGLSPRTLEKLRVSGNGPAYYKMGRAVSYGLSDLEAWVTNNRRCSTTDNSP